MQVLKAKESTQNILEKEASEGNAENSGPSDSGEGCQQSETAVSPPYRLSIRQFLLFLGPGLLMSVAYLVRSDWGGSATFGLVAPLAQACQACQGKPQ